MKPATVRRWDARLADAGIAGLLAEHKGPKRKSKLTADTVAAIRQLRQGGATYRAITAATGVSQGSVCNALKSVDAGAGDDDGQCRAPAGSDGCLPPESETGAESEPEHPATAPVAPAESVAECVAPTCDATATAEPDLAPEVDGGTESDCPATAFGVVAMEVPVLADPAQRRAERVLARFGLIESAPPVFTGCARAPLAGLLLALPALAASGLLETAHEVYSALPNGFYSLDTMLCEGVFRALLGETRAEAAARVDPVALGRVLGLDRAPEVKTIRRKIRAARAGGQGRRLDRRDGASSCPGPPRAGGSALRRRACARLSGHPQDRENPCAAVEVPRPGHGGNLGVRCRRGSAAGGDGRTGRFPGRRAAPVDPRAARHRRRRPPGAGRVRPRRLVPDAVRRPERGRVRHPDLAQGRHRRHRRAPVHRAHPHRRARPHPHLGTRRHRDRTGHRRRASHRARCSRCARSACSMPPQPGRCTS